MKSTLHIILLFAFITSCDVQENEKFNLGFENHDTAKELPDGWFKWGSYKLSIDSDSYSGDKSGKISSGESDSAFGSLAYKIPANYHGKTIQLEGYMKIKNVSNGFAGLLLRIDGNGGSLAFDNMQSQNITGTKDWKQYTITLDYPEGAESIFVAGILVGKGEAWFDDFKLTIDGEDIQSVERELAKAELDKEFDSGSELEFPELSKEKIDNLEVLGKVWGFLKYHHPKVAKGNYNWDYELFRILPDYLEIENIESRDQLIVDWIDKLGELEKCNNCLSESKDSYLKPDHDWFNKLEGQLQEKLSNVYHNRSQGKHFYIRKVPNVGNPEFINENSYSSTPYPDDGFRLLSLYRYWNIINYFFPSKYLIDKNWDTVLRAYIPVFLNASNELEYELATIKLIGEIHDSHANLLGGADKIDQWKGENYPPIHVRFIEDKLVVTDYYNPELKSEVQLEFGDVITKINGVSIGDLIEEKSPYYPASNRSVQLRDLSADLLRSNDSEVNIDYKSSNNLTRSKALKLYPKDSLDIYKWYRRTSDRSYRLLENNIGYVTLQSIKKSDILEIKKEFKNTAGIIIDIRNYPSHFVVFDLGSYFVYTPTPFVKFTTGNIDNPGEFTFTEPIVLTTAGETFQGKLVVLINELTQSQAEYTAMALRAGYNTTLIGSTTAGADGNISTIYLPGGLRTMISGIGVYYPNGEETQRVGIVPDMTVEPTVNGIRQRKDELLEAAIELILKK